MQAYQIVNHQLVITYWEIGRYIVEYEQGGKQKAAYGKRLLEKLSEDLSRLHGKGFSRSNLNYMRSIYQQYPICETLSHKLSWSHYVELLKIDDLLERSFYEKEFWQRKKSKTKKAYLLQASLSLICYLIIFLKPLVGC